jgi:hypothetical protein
MQSHPVAVSIAEFATELNRLITECMRGFGRSKVGGIPKIHLLADARTRPVVVALTPDARFQRQLCSRFPLLRHFHSAQTVFLRCSAAVSRRFPAGFA